MKSIQSKFILLILMGIVVSAAIIGGGGIISYGSSIDSDSEQIINLMCDEKAHELNNIFGRIEQSVQILSEYAVDNLESIERLSSDDDYSNEYIGLVDELSLTAVRQTEGAVAVYIRLNPDISSSKSGAFRVINLDSGQFEAVELTDLSAYSEDDIEHVGWYWIPVNKGAPTWLLPYYNRNIDIYMISYVVPIYKDGSFLGVVGMDIDFNHITDSTDSITVYDTGCAFLTDENLSVIHHKECSSDSEKAQLRSILFSVIDNKSAIDSEIYSYLWNGGENKLAFRTLDNGMFLGFTAPTSEIDFTKNTLILRTAVSALVIAVIFILITSVIARNIAHPLKELNAAAKEIAGGNLDISLTCKSKDEVGTLTESPRQTADQLKLRIDYINSLAFTDKLTGIKNNTSYMHETAELKEEIRNSDVGFAVAVIDVNGLKHINDRYGHDKGNELIISSANVIAGVFGYENVYRIGGDEFAVLMKNTGAEDIRSLAEEFSRKMSAHEGTIKLSAAIGTAVYDRNTDDEYERVFKRADAEMYKNKSEMKARGENSEVIDQKVH